MKILPWALLALLLGGLYWQHQRHEQARARVADVTREKDALLDRIKDRDGSITLLTDSVAYYRAEADSAEARAGREIAVAQGEATEAERRLRDWIRTHPTTGDPEADLDALLAAHRREVRALMTRINSLVLLTASQNELIDTQTAQIADYENATARLEELVAYWEAEARRDWWENPMITVPVAAGGTLAVAGLLNAVIQ